MKQLSFTAQEALEKGEALYKIVRFKRGGKNKVIQRNVTLAYAQAHCSSEHTKGEGWFDGYERQ